MSYGALFLGIGIGLRHGPLGGWALALGLAGVVSAVASMFVNLQIDKHQGGDGVRDAVGYPAFAGIELEDGIYLLAPITWLGLLTPFFTAAAVGAAVYCLWSLWTLIGLRRG